MVFLLICTYKVHVKEVIYSYVMSELIDVFYEVYNSKMYYIYFFNFVGSPNVPDCNYQVSIFKYLVKSDLLGITIL